MIIIKVGLSPSYNQFQILADLDDIIKVVLISFLQ